MHIRQDEGRNMWPIENPSPIVVVCMHRSGSTLLTQMLESCCVFWGAEVDMYNEAKCFQLLNEKLLRATKATWDNPKSLFQFLQNDVRLLNAEKKIRKSLNTEFFNAYFGYDRLSSRRFIKDSAYWGWKDPRNTFSIPVWNKIFPSMHIIHIVRNGIDVAASLWRREKSRHKKGDPHYSNVCQSIEGCFNLWKYYVMTARQNIKEIKNIIEIRFEDLIEQPVNTLKSLNHFIGLNLDPNLDPVLPTIMPEKSFAFRNDKKLFRFWHLKKKDPLLAELGYTCH